MTDTKAGSLSRPSPREDRRMPEARVTDASRSSGDQLVWVPTVPELKVSIRETAPDRPGEVSPPRVVEVAGEEADAGRITPMLGLSERPEPYAERDRAALVRLDGATAGRVHSISASGVEVGRHSGTSLQITDVGISRSHARLYCNDGDWWIEDLGSRNGTYVEGRAVRRQRIPDGCLLRFGPRATFRFQLMDARQEAAFKGLFENSHRDCLTGVHNRRYLDDRLRMELAFAMRHDTQLSVVLIDIDHFKRVNDTYGHLAGDEILRHVATTIRRQLRAEDVFARYGGEEFAIVLRDIGLVGAGVAAERVREKVEKSPVQVSVGSVSVTASAGCAALDECEAPTIEHLIRLADRRLYAAKLGGRNRVVIAD